MVKYVENANSCTFKIGRERCYFMIRYPKIFCINSSRRDKDRKKFSFCYLNSKFNGDFKPLSEDHVSNLIKSEIDLSINPFEINEEGCLSYANIVLGYRDQTSYFFRIDSRNGLNREIQVKMPTLFFFQLNYSFYVNYQRVETRYFYLVKNQEELSSFVRIFSDWLIKQDFSINN